MDWDLIQVAVRLEIPELTHENIFIRVNRTNNEPIPFSSSPSLFGPRRNRNCIFNTVKVTSSVAHPFPGSALKMNIPVVLSLQTNFENGLPVENECVRFQIMAGVPKLEQFKNILNEGEFENNNSILIGEATCYTRDLALAQKHGYNWLELPLQWTSEQQQLFSSSQVKFESIRMKVLPLGVSFWKIMASNLVDALLARSLLYPVVRSFLLGDGLVNVALASEVVYESAWCFDVPVQLLRIRLKTLVSRVQKWETLFSNTRMAQCRFDSPNLAAKHGYQYITVSITAAHQLVQVQHHTQVQDPPGKNTMVNAFASMVQSAQRISRDKAVVSSGKLSNPFIRLSYDHPLGHTIFIGQTKTVSRTDNPRFTSCVLHPDSPASLVHPNVFGFYVPVNPDVLLNFEVFHERTSGLTQRVSYVPMMQGKFPLQGLLHRKSQGPVGGTIRLELNSFQNNESGCLGRVDVAIHSNIVSKPELFSVTTPSVFPSNRTFLSLPVVWLEEHIQRLHQDVAQLNRFLSATMAAQDRLSEDHLSEEPSSAMKQSTVKKDFDVGAIPTNLHVTYFVVESVGNNQTNLTLEALDPLSRHQPTKPIRPPRPTSHGHPPPPPLPDRPAAVLKSAILKIPKATKIFPFTTCGIPAAHCLGFHSQDALLHEASNLENARSKCNFWSADSPERLPSLNSDISEWWDSWKSCAEIDRKYFLRESVVMSQALSIVVTCFVSELLPRLEDSASNWLNQIHHIGWLLGWESLVSTQGKEMGMLEDCIAILGTLQCFCRIYLVSENVHACICTTIKLNESEMGIFVRIPSALFVQHVISKIPDTVLQNGISIVAALFTQGVNEMQTFANMTSFLSDGSSKQVSLNRESQEKVEQYYERLMLFSPVVDALVHSSVLELKQVVQAQQKSQKDVDLLLKAQVAVRSLLGGRITFCKSGKDRTAMSVTLEQSKILSTIIGKVDEIQFANILREFGIRIVVAEKNVGRPKYSFNAAQRQLLPVAYRPPTTTIQDFFTSVKARDS